MKNIFSNKKFQIPLVVFLIGLILMVSADILFPDTDSGVTDNPTVIKSSETGGGAEDKLMLENQIESLIESIGGVKSAAVVITFENSGELYIKQDEERTDKVSKENDGEGGERNIDEHTSSQKTIYVEGSDGSKYPFVVSEKYAEIRGVAVVVKGTYDASIKEKIVRTLEVLLNVPAHKIQVVW